MCPRHWGNCSICWSGYLHAATLPYPNGMQTARTQWTLKKYVFTFWTCTLTNITDQLPAPTQSLMQIQPPPETSLSIYSPFRARKPRATNQFNWPVGISLRGESTFRIHRDDILPHSPFVVCDRNESIGDRQDTLAIWLQCLVLQLLRANESPNRTTESHNKLVQPITHLRFSLKSSRRWWDSSTLSLTSPYSQAALAKNTKWGAPSSLLAFAGLLFPLSYFSQFHCKWVKH